jgi:phage internal scaffolding protein|tara:strand:- start:3562 stop:4023 length:462 start_codon:yes stop_codon:yes gene_type:complete
MAKKSLNNIEFKTPYTNPPARCWFETTGESMTQQHFAEESEINNILRSHDRNGVIEHIHRGNAIYGDFSNITDFSDALDQIREAQQEFLNVPSEIREKFQNDAGQFFKFASDPNNLDELIKMGLANPKQSEAMHSDQPAIPEAVEPQNSEAQE